MGRYGQAILTIVGTVVGAYFGYPALGAALGSLAGGLLFPTQLPTISGPRLSDISSTSASVGTNIPRGWGTFPAAGTVIWQSDVREVIVSDEVGGKGAPTQTVETPTYYQDFAIGLNDGEIDGVRIIWANGKVIYDRRPQRADESTADFNARLAANDALEEQMIIYTGTEDQLPDPTIETAEGVDEISAFRGLAYAMFINWLNKPEDGNRMPGQWKFECYRGGSSTVVDTTEYSNQVLYPWKPGDDPINALNYHEVTNLEYGALPVGSGGPYEGLGYNAMSEALTDAEQDIGLTQTAYHGYSTLPDAATNRITGDQVGPYASEDPLSIYQRWNHHDAVTGDASISVGLSPCDRILALGGGPVHADIVGWAVYQMATDAQSPSIDPEWTNTISCGGPSFQGQCQFDISYTVTRVPQAPPDPCSGGTVLPYAPSLCISASGQLTRSAPWVLDSSQQYRMLQIFNNPGTVVYPLNPVRPLGHAEDTQAFWESAYAVAVARGLMPEGLVYGVGYPITQNWAYIREFDSRTIDTVPVSIGDIVKDLCVEAGMDLADIDTTAIDALTVIGYVRTRVMPARAAIDPLRSVGFFDGIESNRLLKFVRRGGAIVATIGEDELGWAVQGETPPSKVTTRKLQDFDLPRQVRVHYLSQARDYEPGQQDSPVRIETSAVNDIDIELPVVLDENEASKIASVIWADYWASRWTHEIVLDSRYQYLEPTDCIEIPVDGEMQRMRIVTIEDSLPNIRKLSLNRDDDGNYVSYAVGSVPPIRIPPLDLLSPAELILLDLPPLRDEDDNAGIYGAVRPFLTDANFRGASILRSTDGGGNYTTIATAGSVTPIGYLGQTLSPDGPGTIWDEGNTITIELQAGTLESRPEAAVLAGANAAALGAHGRWEILQFRDAVQIGPTTWQISGLLRGRRGTEQHIGTEVEGDRFVMLSTGALLRLPLDLALVGKELKYKAVATGLTIDSATEINFTGAGEALKPFSPGNLHCERDSLGNSTITWVRRGRFGQTLQPGTDVALSEEVEDYEVEIYLSGSAVRTISVSTQAATYTAQQQIIDFGAVQSALLVRVYQISAAVGRGAYEERTV